MKFNKTINTKISQIIFNFFKNFYHNNKINVSTDEITCELMNKHMENVKHLKTRIIQTTKKTRYKLTCHALERGH